MKELHTRTIWGILFATVLTGAILLGPYSFGVLFLMLSVLALHEFYALCKAAGFSPQVYPGLFIGFSLFALSFFYARGLLPSSAYSYLIPLIFIIPVYELSRKKKNPLANIALTAFGPIFVSIPFSLLNFLVFLPGPGGSDYNFTLLISLFLFVWAADSGAYLFGVRFGKHRLLERISPKKSWEGMLGGIGTALAMAWILTKVFPQFSFLFMSIMALVIVIAGTLGDLVESMIKRSIGVKDSGRFMPGHGGILDRFDSILLASPMIYFTLQFFL